MKAFEYEQQLEYLKMSIDDIRTMLDNKGVTYAYIVHDKDVDTAPHLHVMVKLNSDMTIDNVAKWFKDEKQHINIKKSRWENKLAYLCHRTKDSQDKYQYDFSEVIANFDYPATMDKIVKNYAQKVKVDEVLQMICDNKIPRVKIGDYLSDLDRINYDKRIEKAYRIRDEKVMKDVNRKMDVIYLYGPAGVGKTTYAKMLAQQKGYSVFVSSSSNDLLDGYLGQECIILDDLRGSSMRFSDLLKFLDNNTGSLVKSRYKNKLIDAKLIIITSIYSPQELYTMLEESSSEPVAQLLRRIPMCVYVSKNVVSWYLYNPEKLGYVWVNDLPNLALLQFDSVDELKNTLDGFVGSMQRLNSEIIQSVQDDPKKLEEVNKVLNEVQKDGVKW